jgi:hypothetical protein
MKKLLLTVSILTAFGLVSYSQISYHDIKPDTTVNTWNNFTIAPSSSSTNDIVVWFHPVPEVVIQTHGLCEILFSANSLPAKLSVSDSIGPSGTWLPGTYNPLNSGSSGNWRTDATDKYIGFRFKNSSSSTWYYGWLMMSVAPGAASFTVKEWAFNTSGNKINAGQTTTTGINTIAHRSTLTTYPNPARDKIQIQWKAADVATLTLTNAAGSIVKRTELAQGSRPHILDTKDIVPGIYHIILKSGNDIYTGSFIKQ